MNLLARTHRGHTTDLPGAIHIGCGIDSEEIPLRHPADAYRVSLVVRSPRYAPQLIDAITALCGVSAALSEHVGTFPYRPHGGDHIVVLSPVFVLLDVDCVHGFVWFNNKKEGTQGALYSAQK